jgi:membrane protease YdiL (CAAX protease family)
MIPATLRISLLQAIIFVGVGCGLVIAAGPVVGILAATTGMSTVPVWTYAAVVTALLLAATVLALRWDGTGLHSLGFVPTRDRFRELALGLTLGAVLFALMAIVRGAMAGAEWTFSELNASLAAGLVTALLFLLPEELLFRGYAFQRLVHAVGAWPGILMSAALFGLYHLAGSGMWGMGAFFQAAMPALGGVLFGWAAVRTRGLALPIGLHLGGNWVQSAVFSFRPHADGAPAAGWTAYLTDHQQQLLYAPDLSAHAPYIGAMLVAVVALRMVLRSASPTDHDPSAGDGLDRAADLRTECGSA